ncbi:unnamed protein product, partial [Tetraodon nigroviridis]
SANPKETTLACTCACSPSRMLLPPTSPSKSDLLQRSQATSAVRTGTRGRRPASTVSLRAIPTLPGPAPPRQRPLQGNRQLERPFLHQQQGQPHRAPHLQPGHRSGSGRVPVQRHQHVRQPRGEVGAEGPQPPGPPVAAPRGSG